MMTPLRLESSYQPLGVLQYPLIDDSTGQAGFEGAHAYGQGIHGSTGGGTPSRINCLS
jgi:hypothetical protein